MKRMKITPDGIAYLSLASRFALEWTTFYSFEVSFSILNAFARHSLRPHHQNLYPHLNSLNLPKVLYRERWNRKNVNFLYLKIRFVLYYFYFIIYWYEYELHKYEILYVCILCMFLNKSNMIYHTTIYTKYIKFIVFWMIHCCIVL